VFYYYIGHQSLAEATNSICKKIARHNILFVKVFQYLSSFEGNIPSEITKVLKTYTTHAFVNPVADIDYELLEYIERKYGVKKVQSKPNNAGMIAVIFNGVIKKTGELVVIKIKKKNIDDRVNEGCMEISCLYSVIKYWSYYLKKVESRDDETMEEMLTPFVDNIENLKAQCNFEREIAILKQSKRDLGILDEIITIPTVYNDFDDIVDTKFIIMERMNGVHENPQNVCFGDRKEYARIILLYSMYHIMRPYHMLNLDLHQGNYLMTYDGLGRPHLNIIDFGMSEALNEKESANLSKLLYIAYDYMKNKETIDISKKYNVIFLFREFFSNVDFDKLTVEQNVLLNEKVSEFVIEILGGTAEPNHKVMYSILKSVSEIIGHTVRFKNNIYNYCLGLAIGNRTIMNFIGGDMKVMTELYKKNLEFLLEE
jgi:predicted unusual protein kinase regulating ubiquinone biosynthesis (AarF/ABC1/UbiB family)